MAGVDADIDPGFHDGQAEVARSQARFRVLAAGRRWGKTRLGVWECLKVGSEGGRAWWVAPTYPLATEGWRPLRLIGQQWPGAKVLEVDKEVRLPGGGLVQVRSADDPQRLRGAGLDFVVVDEAAFCKQEAWEEALRPALSDKQGRAMFISTPKGLNWFYDLYGRADGRDGWQRWRFPTSANPYMPEGEVAVAEAELPSLVFRQEYLAEFVEAKGARYDSAWFRFFSPSVKDGLTWLLWDGEPVDYRECERFCTVDLAASTKTSADWTVICSCAAWHGVLFVLDVVRRRMEGPDIVPAIESQMRRHDLRVAHIESAGFQLSLVQEARRAGLAVQELKPDRDKVARSLPLEARMEHGQVWFAQDAAWLPDLQRELLAFPAGEHDDQVDALAYAAAVVAGRPRKHDWSSAAEDDLAGQPWRP